MGDADFHSMVVRMSRMSVDGATSTADAPLDAAGPLGSTALIMATTQGDVGLVRSLLEARASVDLEGQEFNDDITSENKVRRTPMHAAAEHGHVEVMKVLLGARASVDVTKSDDGSTPLLVAAQNNRFDIAELLIERGADIDSTTTDTGDTVVLTAAQDGHLKIVLLLAENGADLDQPSTDGCSPCWVASQNGHVEVVRSLIEHKVNLDHQRTQDGLTALNIAAYKKRRAIVHLLLQNGADHRLHRNNGHGGVLHGACSGGDLEIVKTLCIHGCKRFPPGSHYSALHVALHRGHEDIVAWLGGLQEDVWTSKGQLAVYADRPELTLALITAGYIDPEDACTTGTYTDILKASASVAALSAFRKDKGEGLWLGEDPDVQDKGATNEEASRKTLTARINAACQQVRTPAMIRLIEISTAGWKPRTHRFHHRGVRQAVHTLLLTAERLWRLAEARTDPDPEPAPEPEPADGVAHAISGGGGCSRTCAHCCRHHRSVWLTINVPIEIWVHILGFVSRKQHAVPLEGRPSENEVIYGTVF